MSIRTIVCLSVVVIIAFGLAAQFPFWMHPQLDDASKYGDAFGVPNAIFSSFGFLLVAITLLMQMHEIRENSKSQKEQAELQQQQVQLTERTAQLQRELFDDSRRQVIMQAFLKIQKDAVSFRNALLAWHPNERPDQTPQTEKRLRKEYFDAWTELRGNCTAVGLLFGHKGDSLGKAIQDYYAEVHSWTERPRTNTIPLEECQEIMNRHIHNVEQAMKPLWALVAPDSPK